MSTPSESQSPDPVTGPAQPRTQELPVVAPASARTTVQQLPPPSSPAHRAPQAPQAPASAPVSPVAPAAGPTPVTAPQATGRVDYVPGPPGAAPAAPAVTATQQEMPRAESAGADAGTGSQPDAPRDRGALVGVGLVLLSLVLLQFGLLLGFGAESFWSALPLWSSFATVCVVLGLAASTALLPAGRRLDPRTGWRIAAGGLTGLAVFWVLVVLPAADTDRGFLHTAALGALAGAVWLATGRDDD